MLVVCSSDTIDDIDLSKNYVGEFYSTHKAYHGRNPKRAFTLYIKDKCYFSDKELAKIVNDLLKLYLIDYVTLSDVEKEILFSFFED